MGVDITAHVIIENKKSETNKYIYLGSMNANFLLNYVNEASEWQERISQDLQNAFLGFVKVKNPAVYYEELNRHFLYESIEDRKEEIKEQNDETENDYHIVHNSRSKAAVEAAMERIKWRKKSISSKNEEIESIQSILKGMAFIERMDFAITEFLCQHEKETHFILEYW